MNDQINDDPKLTLKIDIPYEFIEQCEQDGVDPQTVLNGFMNDLCHLPGNNGSDERMKAREYYDRVGYPYWRNSR